MSVETSCMDPCSESLGVFFFVTFVLFKNQRTTHDSLNDYVVATFFLNALSLQKSKNWPFSCVVKYKIVTPATLESNIRKLSFQSSRILNFIF